MPLSAFFHIRNKRFEMIVPSSGINSTSSALLPSRMLYCTSVKESFSNANALKIKRWFFDTMPNSVSSFRFIAESLSLVWS